MILESMVIKEIWFKKTQTESGICWFIDNKPTTEQAYRDKLKSLRTPV